MADCDGFFFKKQKTKKKKKSNLQQAMGVCGG